MANDRGAEFAVRGFARFFSTRATKRAPDDSAEKTAPIAPASAKIESGDLSADDRAQGSD